MLVQQQNAYRNAQINTANPGELTLMLFNGCIRFLKQAELSIQQQDYEAKHLNTMKALNIIEELQITLDMKYEISKSLYALYDYMKELITRFSMKIDMDALRESINLLTELKDTWAEALKAVKVQQ